MPEMRPVALLNVNPGVFDMAGEIEKLSIAPPVDEIEYPFISAPCIEVTELFVRVNEGAARFTVMAKVRSAVPDAFVAVIV